MVVTNNDYDNNPDVIELDHNDAVGIIKVESINADNANDEVQFVGTKNSSILISPVRGWGGRDKHPQKKV